MNSSRLWTRRMSTSDAGRNPRTPRSRIRPPLTTSITVPSTGSPDSAAASILRHAFSNRARFFDRIRRPSWSSLVSTRASTWSPSETSSAGSTERRIDSSVDGDDALRLVADVDQDLVLVDPHDLAADDVALVEGLDRRVVVGDELAVDLDHEVVGAVPAGGGLGASAAASVVVSVADTAANYGRSVAHPLERHRSRAAARLRVASDGLVPSPACRRDGPSAARNACRWRRVGRADLRRELRGARGRT